MHPPQAQCAECHRALTGFYFDVDGQTVCEACKYTIESRMTEVAPAPAALCGRPGPELVAAALGAAIYYAISALTGYEFGLDRHRRRVSRVGGAVRWGSDGRGGKRYQALAMALTYLAIVATYIPPIVQRFSARGAPDRAEAAGWPDDETPRRSRPPQRVPQPSRP